MARRPASESAAVIAWLLAQRGFQCRADLVVVLAEHRRRPHVERALAVERDRRPHRAEQRPSTGCSADAVAAGARPADRRAPRWCRTSARAGRRWPRAAAPLGAGAPHEVVAEHLDQLFLVRRCGPRGSRSAGRRTGRAARSRCARPCQNFSGDDMCSAIHLPSAHGITYDCDTLGRLYGPITSSAREQCVKASRLKCAIASSIETSTVRPLPGAAALVQRAEDAVGGVVAGHRVGDRRADDARVPAG